jgi:hypothetical protein
VSPLPWIAGAIVYARLAKRGDSLGASVALVFCFVSLALAVAGLFGLLHHHSHAAEGETRPPRGVLILAAVGIVGGMVTAMSSVLLSDLDEG